MNRTAPFAVFSLVCLVSAALAQGSEGSSAAKAQVSPVNDVVAAIVRAEGDLSSLRLTLATTGKLPGGHEVSANGELRVLQGTQGGPAQKRFTRFEYAFGDGLRGRMETAQTGDGIVIFEEDPAFGAVFVRIGPEIVSDLEWASGVVKKSDLPGMLDSRANAPLGSGMIKDLMRTFDLKVAKDTVHGSDTGKWLRGKRKPGLDTQDAELPLPDRVEVFVRDRDSAATIARFFVGKDVVQQIAVSQVEVDVALGADAFTVDGHGERIRNVQDYAPMWELLQGAIEQAEAKAKEGEVRPSLRKDAEGAGKIDPPKDGGQKKADQKKAGK